MPVPPKLLLIDVQNVLHAVGELRHVMRTRAHEEAIEHLISAVQSFPRVWLFEDGGVPSAKRIANGCWRVGSGANCADNQIITWLQQHSDQRPALLISADRDLCLRARAQGARTMTPESFWRKYIGAHETAQEDDQANTDRQLSDQEVAMWMDLFGADDVSNDNAEGER